MAKVLVLNPNWTNVGHVSCGLEKLKKFGVHRSIPQRTADDQYQGVADLARGEAMGVMTFDLSAAFDTIDA